MDERRNIVAVASALAVCAGLTVPASATMAQETAEPAAGPVTESDTDGEPAETPDGEPSAAAKPETEPPAAEPKSEPESPVSDEREDEPVVVETGAAAEAATEPKSALQPEVASPLEATTENEESSWTDRIRLKGDLRYRFETIDHEEKDFRYRHRIRARPGVVAAIVEDLDVTIQLGTGGIDDPVSNNQSLTEAFSSKPIWLDLAFFDWHPGFGQGFSLVGGKMKNPYYKVGKTELLWDPDLNPEGLALRFKRKFGMVEPFANGSAFWVEERKEDDDSWMFGAQGGIKLSFADGVFYVLAGGGYVDYMTINGQVVFWDPMDSFGNSANPVDADGDGEPEAFTYANDFNLVNGFLEIGGKIGSLPWAAFGDFVTNTAVDDNGTGWLVGALLGKTGESLDFHFRYIYREVKSDAVLGIFTDSDFIGGGADGKGHEWNLAFVPTKHVTLAFTYFYNFTPAEDGATYQRSQTDLKLKF